MSQRYDLLVVGSGPGGQKAAIQGAKAGASVAIIERARSVGGTGVLSGALPARTFRETAMALSPLRGRSARTLVFDLPEETIVETLSRRMGEVVRGHEAYVRNQLERNGVQILSGRARFVGPHELEIESVGRERCRVFGEAIIIATGSRSYHPSHIPVDHENVLDCGSLLSMTYLPRTLAVLGAGMIGSEYASIFGQLGVSVTLIEERERPLGFLDPDLTHEFERCFRNNGGSFRSRERAVHISSDGLGATIQLAGGDTIRAEKVLVALGRVPNLEYLDLPKAGLHPLEPGAPLLVDEHFATAAPHIYGVGDVIGPPYLAAWAMEQGRRAALHALGLKVPSPMSAFPGAIFTMPEMATVGLTEPQARGQFGTVLVGIARYSEVARSHISGVTEGFLKIVADPMGHRILGIHIAGENASELIHLGQFAVSAHVGVQALIDQAFNFPTFGEAYRIAALDITGQRARAGLHAA